MNHGPEILAGKKEKRRQCISFNPLFSPRFNWWNKDNYPLEKSLYFCTTTLSWIQTNYLVKASPDCLKLHSRTTIANISNCFNIWKKKTKVNVPNKLARSKWHANYFKFLRVITPQRDVLFVFLRICYHM